MRLRRGLLQTARVNGWSWPSESEARPLLAVTRNSRVAVTKPPGSRPQNQDEAPVRRQPDLGPLVSPK